MGFWKTISILLLLLLTVVIAIPWLFNAKLPWIALLVFTGTVILVVKLLINLNK